MKTKKEAIQALYAIKKGLKSGKYSKTKLRPLELEAIPIWIEWLEDYVDKGKVPEGEHNPVRLWLVSYSYSPILELLKEESQNKEYKRSDFIVTTHPTQSDVDRAEKEDKLVVNPVRSNDISHDWLNGYFCGLGISTSPWLIVLRVDHGADLEESAEIWIRNFIDLPITEPLLGFTSIRGFAEIPKKLL